MPVRNKVFPSEAFAQIIKKRIIPQLEIKQKNYPILDPQRREGHVGSTFGHLTFEGLPKGSNPANVVRCIELLEHVADCQSEVETCQEGEGCRRTRQVLAHHFRCKNIKRGGKGECSICHQLRALCRNHSDHCQATEGNCAVPYCKNKKLEIPNSNTIRANPQSEEQTKKEYQYVIKRLSEVMALPSKQQKLQGIERLLETNRQTTVHVLRHILGKKQKLKSATLSQQMKNLTIGKGMKPVLNCRHMAMDPAAWSSSITCKLKLMILKPSFATATCT